MRKLFECAPALAINCFQPLGRVMAARSVLVKLVNKTDFTLSIDSDNCSLKVGEWATKPPESISAQSTGQWESESDSYDDGTVGHCHYIIQDGTDTWVSVNWSNPFS